MTEILAYYNNAQKRDLDELELPKHTELPSKRLGTLNCRPAVGVYTQTLSDMTCTHRQLRAHNVEGAARIALRKRLAQARYHRHARLGNRRRLRSHDLVALALLAPLRVPNYGIFNARVLKQRNGRLPRVRTSAGERILQ